MKILFKINDNKLSIINRKKLNDEYKNMLNTNVISHDELIFSDTYIIENEKLVYIFLNELIKNYNLNTLSFQNNEVAQLIFPLLNKIKGINIINFESDETLSYSFTKILIKCNEIKYVSAGYIPAYLFELLDKYDIVPESRNEILFTSEFMTNNSLYTYSQLYYKKSINLEFPLENDDFLDLETFLAINKGLRIINVNIPNRFHLEEVISLLKNNNKKNIKIILHGDIHDIDTIEYLKKNNKILQKKYKISFKLKYTDSYIKENIAKQTNNNILRTCGIIILGIVLLTFAYVFYDNYRSMLNVAQINNEINEYIEESNTTEIVKEIEKENDGKTVKNDYIAVLKEINPDTVGWLKVNNTNIDYAILQSNNNDYYLEYNIYKEKDPNGWVFLDYENNPDNLDDNNIIYGHNRLINGVMFGTLNKVVYKSWYTNPDNQIITYDTLYNSYKFQIFSIYNVDTTNDYIKTNFKTIEQKMKFINTILSRSIHNFNIPVNENSKILTLSTCASDTSRLVIHGVLIEE